MIDAIITALGGRVLLFTAVELLALCLVLGIDLKIQSNRLDIAQAMNKVQAVQLQGFGDQIAAQNTAVDQLLANAAAQQAHLRAAEAAAGQVRLITQDRIRYVDRAAIPSACPEAVTWGAAHAIEIGRRWEQEVTTP